MLFRNLIVFVDGNEIGDRVQDCEVVMSIVNQNGDMSKQEVIHYPRPRPGSGSNKRRAAGIRNDALRPQSRCRHITGDNENEIDLT